MNFTDITKENYSYLLKYIESFADDKYREFHSKIVNNTSLEIFGVRTPQLKNIAREILKGDYKGYLLYSGRKYYEEVMLRGFVSAQIKVKDFKEAKKLTEDFLPYIDNWAVCDGYCSSFKGIKKYLPEYFDYIQEMILNENSWYKRVGLVLMLNYYLSDEYIERVLERCKSISCDEYYVKMAQAWLYATAFIQYSDRVKTILCENNIDKLVKKMTIQKCIDSYRVSPEDKNYLRMLRKK